MSQHLVAGATSGLISAVAFQPLDLVKVHVVVKTITRKTQDALCRRGCSSKLAGLGLFLSYMKSSTKRVVFLPCGVGRCPQ